MRFRRYQNENEGLSYFQQNFQVMSGVPPVDMKSWINKPQFNSVATALYARAMKNLSAMQVISMTINPSYVPDFLRAYMETASVDGEAYTPARLEKHWVPVMERKGFDSAIVRVLFKEFEALNKAGLVPRMIWMPDAKTGDAISSGGGGVAFAKSNVPVYLAIGAGILAVGGLIVVAKKRKRVTV